MQKPRSNQNSSNVIKYTTGPSVRKHQSQDHQPATKVVSHSRATKITTAAAEVEQKSESKHRSVSNWFQKTNFMLDIYDSATLQQCLQIIARHGGV
jgi:hypothetical protein